MIVNGFFFMNSIYNLVVNFEMVNIIYLEKWGKILINKSLIVGIFYNDNIS